MPGKLNTFVHATAVDKDGNIRSKTFGPDDDVPDWAVRAITNPHVWVGRRPRIEPEPAPVVEVGPEPPRQGAGSSAKAWREYALSTGWFDEIPESSTREQIIAAVDEQRAERAPKE